jgi:signal transduction histidine kinase
LLTVNAPRSPEAEAATEKGAFEEVLRQTIARLEEANRRKDDFFAVLAHEMRTPLHATLNKSTGALGPVNRDLMQVQGRLKELGHDPGPIDGRLGLETQAALKAFQTDYGLAATGEIDAETRAALGLGRKGPP